MATWFITQITQHPTAAHLAKVRDRMGLWKLCFNNLYVLTDAPGLMFQVKEKGQFRNLIKSSGFLNRVGCFRWFAQQVGCGGSLGEHGEINTNGSPGLLGILLIVALLVKC